MCDVQFKGGIALLFSGSSVPSACSEGSGCSCSLIFDLHNGREMLIKTNEYNSGGCVCVRARS